MIIRHRHRWLPLALIGVGLTLLVAVAAGFAVGRAAAEPSIRGRIVAVDAQTVGRADFIVVRDRNERDVRFRIGDSVDPHWTPGHLREHMTFGEPVTVYYRDVGGTLVAVRITD